MVQLSLHNKSNMKYSITLLVAAFLLTACEQKTSTTSTASNATTDTAIIKTENKDSLALIATLDSIDRTNNQSIIASGNDLTKAYISTSDSSIFLTANIELSHRIFGYALPDIKSKRLLLLSVFTNDVEKNPFGCALGAYYDTGGMQNMILHFEGKSGDFIKVIVSDNSNKKTTVYFENKWFEFM